MKRENFLKDKKSLDLQAKKITIETILHNFIIII